MERQLILTIVIACLASACQKEAESEASDGDDLPTKRQSARSEGGRGDEGGVSGDNLARNSYAEEHWPVADEVENEWTEEFKAASTPDAKIAIVERKQSSGPELLAPLVRLSLHEPDERVRTEAVKTLTSFVGAPGGSVDRGGSPPDDGSSEPEDPAVPEVVDLIVGATHDPSSEVRILAMEAAFELEPEKQVEIFRRTIAGPDEQVRQMTITELGRLRSKPAFEVLMTGLQHSDPEFQAAVNVEINLLVNRRFESFEQASSWWSGHAAEYSDNMLEFGGSN